ncbi:MAG: diaminopimelate epimerase [Myxococcaceae bacterium]|nr:diaminopimelate epimerase [Myxococcaceae bacterium]
MAACKCSLRASVEKFSKYQALGNDFVLLDRRERGVDIDASMAVRLCDRRRGIGADGVLVLLGSAGVDARLRIHNADGSVAQMCGNGLRCVARYLGQGEPLRIATDVGVREATFDAQTGLITVDLGPVSFVAPQLAKAADGGPFVDQPVEGYQATAVSLGNPHLVLFEAVLEEVSVKGPRLERMAGFPERTNVEFCRRQGEGLAVRVWERGAGLTEACGSGAAAAVAAYQKAGQLRPGSWHTVALPGGALRVRVDADFQHAWLKGDAHKVFEGVIDDG